MVKLRTHTGQGIGRLLAVGMVTLTLAACGGGSGDSTDSTDSADVDGDGILNADDTDNDNDGILDIEDPLVDLDGDGFDDPDNDDDGLPDSIDDDADGDGTNDLFDNFVDLDNDGRDDISGETEQMTNFEPVTVDDVCGGEPGDDNNSSDPNWNNNCWVRLASDSGEGQFANSLYTVGIQRVVYCAGFGDGASYTNFADGRFGNLTEAAVVQFQESGPDVLTGDGEVGGRTWAKLQSAIVRLERGGLVENADGSGLFTSLDSYGFAEGRCQDIPLFYQTLSVSVDPATQISTEQELGWSLARNVPNQGQTAPFSISDDLSAID